ncbi:class I SAM-dependent methyltransferase [Nonomuraea sp. NPDC050328]|uniref:class I SAM-dependent methyltransferase n=1 Tax=Nonomuraea sp. NPDC050328 TaxID=3364361 RepID=UPI0037B1A952
MLRAFVEHVDGPILDAGCGPGHVTQITGVGLSPAMIALAREALPHLSFEVGSIAALPHPDGSMGGVLA